MYCTSDQRKLLDDSDFLPFEQAGFLHVPRPYMDFMKTYGIGTYAGALCLTGPDFHILKDFGEYDFWDFQDAPITREQLPECAAIGNSIDGDTLALHPRVKGYLLLPRHSDRISLFARGHKDFVDSLREIGRFLYGEELENYFEPAAGRSLFLHLSGGAIQDLARRFKARFLGDHLIALLCLPGVFPLHGRSCPIQPVLRLGSCDILHR